MSGISSLGIAVSGLSAAQAGLNVLGHNLANSETVGYVRQQALQKDFFSQTIGRNATGLMQIGLGTDIAAIRQIRDKFLDISYRQEVCKTTFYQAKYTAGVELETIIGELQSEYRLQAVMGDMWDALNELSIDPTGVETRGMLVSTAVTFINKVNNVAARLVEYQNNLNDQVKSAVTEINTLLTRINKLNGLIAEVEASGDHANDYRDSRNLALDQLSSLIDINYKENAQGIVNILCGGNELLVNGFQAQIGLRYSAKGCNFVEPVITNKTGILEYDPTNANARPLLNMNQTISASAGNDKGKLLGLLVARGDCPANYTMSPDSIDASTPEGRKLYYSVKNSTIQRFQIELDTLVNSIVTMINQVLAPVTAGGMQDAANAPFGLDGTQFVELFTRKYVDRFDSGGNYNGEDPGNYASLYTIGNIVVNPAIINVKDYDKIPLSFSGDVSDQNALMDMLYKWKNGWTDVNGKPFIAIDSNDPLNVDDFYNQMITNLALETNESKNFLDEQAVLLTQIDNKRMQISGVSLDEEMKNMLIYQHAYNASARILNVIDSMIDKLVNGTGRVGL